MLIFGSGCTGWQTTPTPQKYGKYQFTKLGQLTPRDPKEGVKIISKFFFVTRKQVLRKKQRALWRKDMSENVLYLILGELIARARLNIC